MKQDLCAAETVCSAMTYNGFSLYSTHLSREYGSYIVFEICISITKLEYKAYSSGSVHNNSGIQL